jgi:hypothetical protein
VTRAIQEAALDALVLLRTFDPSMATHPSYVYFPRMDTDDGDTVFSSPAELDSPITHLVWFTSLILQYLSETLTVLDISRTNLSTSEMARVSGIDLTYNPLAGRHARNTLPIITPAPRSSWAVVRSSFTPPPYLPRPHTSTHRTITTPIRRHTGFTTSTRSSRAPRHGSHSDFLALTASTAQSPSPVVSDSSCEYEPFLPASPSPIIEEF